MSINTIFRSITACAVATILGSCDGMFSGLYDTPGSDMQAREGQLIINATSWSDWYYVDFDSLAALAAAKDSAGLAAAQTRFTPYPIPVTLTGERKDSVTGIYTYWYDVFGKGLSVNERRSFRPTDLQPEPKHWSIAVHRDNVRTNGAAVLETNFTSIDQLPKQSSDFSGGDFKPDEWSETDVWVDQSHMLQSLIGNQGIKINKVLSGWLTVSLPPIPPAFTSDSHVFLIRFNNGRYAAVQLENYMNAEGTKCWLTINYKYPY